MRTLSVAGVAVGLTLASCSGPSAHPSAEPCGQPAPVAVSAPSEMVPASAMILSATLEVTPPTTAKHRCVVLGARMNVTLQVGDRSEFEANGPPQVTSDAAAVRISTRPGPLEPAAGGGGRSRHVIVTVTAAQPGTAVLKWINCTGTGC